MDNQTEKRFPIKNKPCRKGYQVMTGAELIKTKMHQRESVIEYLIHKNGVSVLAGPEGVGKTWVGLQVACSLASGVPVFNEFKIKVQKVMIVQFELPLQSLQERLKLMIPYFDDRSKISNWIEKIHLISLAKEDRLFTDQWVKIENTIKEIGFKDGVLIVDNLYTSTDADVSDNKELKPILSRCRYLTNEYNISILLVAHFNKGINQYKELHGDLVQGGKQLLMFANNCLLIGSSTHSNQFRIAKIWKCRDELCPLEHEPFKLYWDEDNLVFHKGEVINNESAHFSNLSGKWEIELIKKLAVSSKQNNYHFNRTQLMTIAEWDDNDKNQRRASRFLNRMVDWGYIKKHDQNDYEIIITEFDND